MVRFDCVMSALRMIGVGGVTALVGCSGGAEHPASSAVKPGGLVEQNVEQNKAVVLEVTRAAGKPTLNSADVITTLRGVAMKASSTAGVSAPGSIRTVAAADRQAALTAMGGVIVNDHVPVYVIELTGGPFTALRHRQGVPPRQGNAMTITVDAQTYSVLDVGFHPEAPDLSRVDSNVVELPL